MKISMNKQTYSVIDNYLDKADFFQLRGLLEGNDFPWFFQHNVASMEDNTDVFFSHVFYNDHIPNSQFFTCLNPLLKKLQINALIRAKANLYTKKDSLIEHKLHKDFDFKHKAVVFCINTNDGFTRLPNGECVPSIANRIILFDGSELHSSTNCTNADTRINININYF